PKNPLAPNKSFSKQAADFSFLFPGGMYGIFDETDFKKDCLKNPRQFIRSKISWTGKWPSFPNIQKLAMTVTDSEDYYIQQGSNEPHIKNFEKVFDNCYFLANNKLWYFNSDTRTLQQCQLNPGSDLRMLKRRYGIKYWATKEKLKLIESYTGR